MMAPMPALLPPMALASKKRPNAGTTSSKKIVAEGWGTPRSGSVFCAESSLRYIYESQDAPTGHAAALKSLVSSSSSQSSLSLSSSSSSQSSSSSSSLSSLSLAVDASNPSNDKNSFKAMLLPKDTPAPMLLTWPNTSLFPTLSTCHHHHPNSNSNSNSNKKLNSMDVDFQNHALKTASPDIPISRMQDDKIDLVEAQIARACMTIAKQIPDLPHSFHECSVCLCPNAYAQIAPCGHIFHSQCFLRWFRANRSCPLCRGQVDSVQLAPIVSVQDEIEAIMAEIDHPCVPCEDPQQQHEKHTCGGAGGIGVPDASGAVSFLANFPEPTPTPPPSPCARMLLSEDPPYALDMERLLENPELMQFLEPQFGDMEMVPLDDEVLTTAMEPVPSLGGVAVADSLQDIVMEPDDLSDPIQQQQQQTTSCGAPVTPRPSVPMQFAPSTTMPDYWNVLNNGMTAMTPAPLMPVGGAVWPTHPALVAGDPAVTSAPVTASTTPRVVHIAPKPSSSLSTLVQAIQTGATTCPLNTVAASFGRKPSSPSICSTPNGSSVSPRIVPSTPRVSGSSNSQASSHAKEKTVSCRCTGGCRNGRCACVKENGRCTPACRCTSCKNPFSLVEAAGGNLDQLEQNACFMQNVPRIRDMSVRLEEVVVVPCCQKRIQLPQCLQRYHCHDCDQVFDFSWCLNKLLDHHKTPRNHCAICKRCSDHRDVHCDACGRCYFAGVTATLPCPCSNNSSKRANNTQSNGASTNKADADPTAQPRNEDDDCVIM